MRSIHTTGTTGTAGTPLLRIEKGLLAGHAAALGMTLVFAALALFLHYGRPAQSLAVVLTLAFGMSTAACAVAFFLVHSDPASAMLGTRIGRSPRLSRWHLTRATAWGGAGASVLLLPVAAVTAGLFVACEIAVLLTMIPFFAAWFAEGPEMSSIRRQERDLHRAYG